MVADLKSLSDDYMDNPRISHLQYEDPCRAQKCIEAVVDRHHQHLVTEDAALANDVNAVSRQEEGAARNIDQIDEVLHSEEPAEESVGPLGQGAKSKSCADVGASRFAPLVQRLDILFESEF